MTSRHVPILVLAALALAAIACGQAETPEPTALVQLTPPVEPTAQPTAPTLLPEPLGPELPAPTAEPSLAGQYDGTWLGITSQGLPITLTIEANVITSLAFDVMMIGSGWTATTAQYHPVAIPILGSQAHAVADFDEWHVEFSGIFNEDHLIGELAVEHIHPQSTAPRLNSGSL